MTKAKNGRLVSSYFLTCCVSLIAIGEGRFWKYQENYIPDGTYRW
ncbi:MAG: hypothetical protein ACLUSV_02865 [Streptococcus sp.]